mgnify:CR=1 FL=1
MEHPPDLPCELLALNEPPATGESYNYARRGGPDFFRVCVPPMRGAVGVSLRIARARARVLINNP